VIGLAAASVATVAATNVLAGGDEPGPGQPAVHQLTVAAERVAGPSLAAPVAARSKAGGRRSKSRKLELIYLETADPQTFPPGFTGATVKSCPGKSKVINGYYFVRDVHQGFGLDDQGGSPSRVRKWSFYLENQNPTPVTDVTLGMICLKPA
jgi:hypothetical protein